MKPAILLDTGPLVAFLDGRDRHHDWTVNRWADIDPPLLTCESVISEACFLLREIKDGSAAVMELISRGVIEASFHLGEEIETVSRLLAKYDDVPMSLADACLVRMSELHAESAVFTIDRDFRIYRRHSRSVIPIISPP
jgi:predicted nucleic acid-binding protein